jgi:hypothetical protein
MPLNGKMGRWAGGSVEPFSPMDLAPILWLSDTGSDPSVWPDISGNGNNSTGVSGQVIIAQNAINGRQVRRVSGSQRYVFGNIQSTLTSMSIYTVSQRSGTQLGGNTYQKIICTSDPTQNNTNLAPNVQILGVFNSSNGHSLEYPPTVRIGRWGGGDRNLLRVSVFADATNTSNNMFRGDVGEIIVFPQFIDQPDHDKMVTYLKAKWDIT